MILFRKFDCLNLFITFICNFKWVEIIKNLLFDKRVIDRFDLIVKIFRLKLNIFIYDILKKKIFDKFYFLINVLHDRFSR